MKEEVPDATKKIMYLRNSKTETYMNREYFGVYFNDGVYIEYSLCLGM